MGDDVVDDGVVGDEADDAQLSGACRTGEEFYLEHPAKKLCPGESACASGR
jgi:hypothetical protein